MFDYHFIDEVKKLAIRVSELYIYGAGLRGHDIYEILNRNGISVSGFVVTEIKEKREKEGLPIVEAREIIHDESIGLILALSDMYTIEVLDYLEDGKMDFRRVVNGGPYLSEYRGVKGLRTEPFLEVTTVIGCKVNCTYCPQKILLGAYYKNNSNRKRVMEVSDFKKILNNIPQNCVVMFAGMAEPYLNPNCTELIKIACDSGRKVRLYTTLQGAKDEDVEEMLKLPLDFVGLHVADKKRNACIETTEKYYKWVERIVNAKKINSKQSFIDDITSQDTPDEKIKTICEGKYEIITAVQDRAGNLNDEYAVGRERDLLDEKYYCVYCGPLVNNHVVLPDGTLLLCQMDYGMKHVLGNLLKNSYESIREGDELKKIFRAMKGNHDCKVLCDTCLCATVVR